MLGGGGLWGPLWAPQDADTGVPGWLWDLRVLLEGPWVAGGGPQKVLKCLLLWGSPLYLGGAPQVPGCCWGGPHVPMGGLWVLLRGSLWVSGCC